MSNSSFTDEDEERRMSPVKYASRTLGKREPTLSTFEREAVAVLLALKKFRQNPRSAAFTLHSDYVAFKNAFGKADVDENLAR